MSRSVRAWSESCAPVSAAAGGLVKQIGIEQQAPLGRLDAISATKWLVRCLVASLLAIALEPALALARSATGTHVNPPTTQNKPQAAGVLLVLGSGYWSPETAARVRAVQRRLAGAGYAPGPVDGRYGPLTEQAVKRFQSARGLAVDGIAGPVTLAALHRKTAVLYPGAGYSGDGSGAVRALQRRLARAGFAPGPIDGRYGPLTEQAVKRFQSARKLQVDGIAGAQTLVHLSSRRRPQHGTRPVRSSRPAGRRQPANRPTSEQRARPQAVPPQAKRTPARRPHVRASRPTSSPSRGLTVALAALLVALGLSVIWLVLNRRKQRQGDAADAQINGGKRPEHRVADRYPTTAPQSERIPNQAATPTGFPHRPAGLGVGPEESDRVFRYAELLEEHGDQPGAIAAYLRADQLAHDAAAARLGLLLEERGDHVAAEAWYRRADQRGNADGAFNLALLLEERGDLIEAMAAYQRADSLGHGAAATNLGVLIEQQGDRAAAENCYRRADQRGDAHGAFNLAVALEKEGNDFAALRAYERADQLGGPPIAELARAAAQQLKRHLERSAGAGQGGGHSGS